MIMNLIPQPFRTLLSWSCSDCCWSGCIQSVCNSKAGAHMNAHLSELCCKMVIDTNFCSSLVSSLWSAFGITMIQFKIVPNKGSKFHKKRKYSAIVTSWSHFFV